MCFCRTKHDHDVLLQIQATRHYRFALCIDSNTSKRTDRIYSSRRWAELNGRPTSGDGSTLRPRHRVVLRKWRAKMVKWWLTLICDRLIGDSWLVMMAIYGWDWWLWWINAYQRWFFAPKSCSSFKVGGEREKKAQAACQHKQQEGEMINTTTYCCS